MHPNRCPNCNAEKRAVPLPLPRHMTITTYKCGSSFMGDGPLQITTWCKNTGDSTKAKK